MPPLEPRPWAGPHGLLLIHVALIMPCIDDVPRPTHIIEVVSSSSLATEIQQHPNTARPDDVQNNPPTLY
jgi:hypothetical protein